MKMGQHQRRVGERGRKRRGILPVEDRSGSGESVETEDGGRRVVPRLVVRGGDGAG